MTSLQDVQTGQTAHCSLWGVSTTKAPVILADQQPYRNDYQLVRFCGSWKWYIFTTDLNVTHHTHNFHKNHNIIPTKWFLFYLYYFSLCNFIIIFKFYISCTRIWRWENCTASSDVRWNRAVGNVIGLSQMRG